MSDYTNLTNIYPNTSYGTSILEAKGFTLKFALDSENPLYKVFLEELIRKNIPYELKDGDCQQKHIWVKT